MHKTKKHEQMLFDVSENSKHKTILTTTEANIRIIVAVAAKRIIIETGVRPKYQQLHIFSLVQRD